MYISILNPLFLPPDSIPKNSNTQGKLVGSSSRQSGRLLHMNVWHVPGIYISSVALVWIRVASSHRTYSKRKKGRGRRGRLCILALG